MPCTKALLAMGEIQSLIVVLRKWHTEQIQVINTSNSSFFDSAPPTPSKPNPLETEVPVIISNLCKLREKLHACSSIEQLDASFFVSPIVEVVKSSACGATPTGVALSTIHRLVCADIVSVRAPNADQAIVLLVEGILSFKFDATGTGVDEVAIMTLLDALLACFKSDAGKLLGDDMVWQAVSTMFPIAVGTSFADMLRGIASRVLSEIFQIVFSQTHLSASSSAFDDQDVDGSQQDDESVSRPATPAGTTSEAPSPAVPVYTPAVARRIFKFLTSKLQLPDPSKPSGDADTSFAMKKARKDAALIERNWRMNALRWLTAIVESSVVVDFDPETNVQTETFVLMNDPVISQVVREEMFLYLIQISQVAGRGAASGSSADVSTSGPGKPASASGGAHSANSMSSMAICYALRLARFFVAYPNIRSGLKVQLELLFNCVYLRVLEGKFSNDQQAKVVLESLCDLLSDPLLAVDLYVNYDCDVKCTNVFENVVVYLSRHAFPMRLQSPALDGLQLLSLQAIIYVVRAISDRCDLAEFPNTVIRDVEGGNSPRAAVLDRFDTPNELLQHKRNKLVLFKCAEAFNRKPKYGIAALREAGILAPTPTDSDIDRIARFLRDTRELDNQAVGQFIGNVDEFNQKVLKAFVHTFDLTGETLLSGLRVFLESFRLPGEAQQIDRILEAFAEVAFAECSDACYLPNTDAAYIFSVAIIMLNTDLHNPNIKPEKKMSYAAFSSLNRNYGEENQEDLPEEMLSSVYNGILNQEINTMTEGSSLTSELTSDRWRDMIGAVHSVPARGTLVLHEQLHNTEIIVGDERIHCGSYDKQMLELIWSPSIAAMSVVFDSGNANQQPGALKTALDGFIHCAKSTAHYNMCKAFDSIVVSLCKFTSLLLYAPSSTTEEEGADRKIQGGEQDPNAAAAPAAAPDASRSLEDGTNGKGESKSGSRKTHARRASRSGMVQTVGSLIAVRRFDQNHKAQMATMCVFAIARRFGSHMQRGWGHVVYCMLRLCDLHLVPAQLLLEGPLFNTPERQQFHEQVRALSHHQVQERVRRERERYEQNIGWLSSWLFGSSDVTDQLLANDAHYQSYLEATVVLEAGLGIDLQRFVDGENVVVNERGELVPVAPPTTPTSVQDAHDVVAKANPSNSLGDPAASPGSEEKDSVVSASSGESDASSVPPPPTSHPSPAEEVAHQHHQRDRTRARHSSDARSWREFQDGFRYAKDCIRSCRLEEIVDGTVALSDEALVALLKAFVFASGGGIGAEMTAANGKRPSPQPETADPKPDATGETTPAKAEQYGVSYDEVEMLASPSLSALLFCIQVATRVVIANKTRIDLLWPLVGTHLMRMISSKPASPLIVIEKASVALLEICVNCMDAENGEFLKIGFSTFSYLMALPQHIAPGLPGLVGLYVSRLFAPNGSLVDLADIGATKPLVWELLFTYFKQASRIQNTQLFDRNLGLIQGLMKSDESYGGLVPFQMMYVISTYTQVDWRYPKEFSNILAATVVPNANEAEHGLLAMLRKYHVVLGDSVVALGEERTVEGDAVPPGASNDIGVVRESWLPLMLEISGIIQRVSWKQVQVSCAALKLLQMCVLDQHGKSLNAQEWALAFEKIFFPTARVVLEYPQQFHKGISSFQAALEKARNDEATSKLLAVKDNVSTVGEGISTLELGMVTMLTKVMVTHFQTIASLPGDGFDKLWLTLLLFFEQYKHRGSTEKNAVALLDGVTEQMKNLLLVAAAEGIIQEDPATGAPFKRWEATWKVVDTFYPGICRQLFPVNLEQQDSSKSLPSAAEDAATTGEDSPPSEVPPLDSNEQEQAGYAPPTVPIAAGEQDGQDVSLPVAETEVKGAEVVVAKEKAAME